MNVRCYGFNETFLTQFILIQKINLLLLRALYRSITCGKEINFDFSVTVMSGLLTVLTVYLFLYGKAYLALSGVGERIEDTAHIEKNTALSAALNTQFLLQIGIFTAVPMVLGFILEQGFLRAVVSFVTMQLQLCAVFFTFSLGTKTHYFGRTILHWWC
ncbi:hypothetical protein L1049_019085 [Liquidambar formosana]|uniref:Glycosyl transferase 48 domain-containing protein n=1 Tax=Liquidambar formosana TaxID=63359 RepID=A0AAP0WNX9_LIQFO